MSTARWGNAGFFSRTLHAVEEAVSRRRDLDPVSVVLGPVAWSFCGRMLPLKYVDEFHALEPKVRFRKVCEKCLRHKRARVVRGAVSFKVESR